eukprot:TRINITY_DN22231_c0_g1_i1.p1 TRINITY_DN22231_c0_g1~~TRINITY_DN22231_c0_g1_i1.p1  ORF type:complete len:596 (-),score=100.92 TRINITY_DN22231_c0_g1_i1:793-2580(-)
MAGRLSFELTACLCRVVEGRHANVDFLRNVASHVTGRGLRRELAPMHLLRSVEEKTSRHFSSFSNQGVTCHGPNLIHIRRAENTNVCSLKALKNQRTADGFRMAVRRTMVMSSTPSRVQELHFEESALQNVKQSLAPPKCGVCSTVSQVHAPSVRNERQFSTSGGSGKAINLARLQKHAEQQMGCQVEATLWHSKTDSARWQKLRSGTDWSAVRDSPREPSSSPLLARIARSFSTSGGSAKEDAPVGWTERLQQQMKQSQAALQQAVSKTTTAVTENPAAITSGEPAAKAVKSMLPTPKKGSRLDRMVQTILSPLHMGRQAATQYREVAALQLEAFFRQHFPLIIGASAVGSALLLWRILVAVASSVATVPEGLANFGFLTLSSTTVAGLYLFLHSRYTIHPNAVYHLTMQTLQMNARALEALGAPLSGSDVRAYVVSGGDLRVRDWRLTLAGRRCFLVFPVRGSERHGLVSAELSKRNGKSRFKILAVDVDAFELPPHGTSSEDEGKRAQRVFVYGDEAAYEARDGIMNELRSPLGRALGKQKDFHEEDEREAAEEKRLAREARERAAVEIEKAVNEAAAKQREKMLADKQKNP